MRARTAVGTFLLSFAVLVLCDLASSQDIVLVVNKGSSISQITPSQVREIFTGTRSRFSDGGRAIPVLLKGGPVHEVFLTHYVGDSPEEFRVRWRKAVFTGQGAMPKEFASESAMLDYVAATPGAIGYVSRVIDPDAVKILVISTQP
jgi:ABC-type phosphate transport system substrate-binding protein